MLHYEIIENHPELDWVVFLHGAGGNLRTWKHQIGDFSEKYNLLLIDLRDHGKSKYQVSNRDKYDFELISQDILQVITNVDIQSAYFVTLSFGSVLVQDFYNRFPEKVKGIVMAGGVFAGTPLLRMFVHFARTLNLFLSYSKMYRLFSYLVMPRERNQKARRVYQLSARQLSQVEYTRWLGLYDEFFQRLGLFQKQSIRTPTFVIMGEDDYIFLPGARNFSRNQPLARLEVLKATGHICNLESPETFNASSLEFLRSIEDPSKTPMTTELSYTS